MIHIPNILQSIKRDLETDTITMDEAARTLCKHGWFAYVPSSEQVYNLLYRTT